MKNTLKYSALAVAIGASLFAQPAFAVGGAEDQPQNDNFATGDFYVGFRSTSATTYDYILDLAPLSNFNFSHSFELTPSSNTSNGLNGTYGNVAAELSTALGSTWFTSGNTLFSVIASTGSHVYSSKASGNFSSSLGSTALSDVTGDLTTMGNFIFNNGSYDVGTSSYDTLVSTSNSDLGFQQLAGTNNSSYSEYQTPSGSFDGLPVNEQTVGSAANFDNLTPSSSTDLGTFSVDSLGDLTFTAAAPVPEPSTWASLFAAVAAVAFLARRRTTAKA